MADMRDENSRSTSGDAGGKASVGGMIESAIVGVGSAIGKVWKAIMADGTLAAAGRQGADELALALKPFPESIQTYEMGTLWSPTPSEIAADRDHGRLSGPPHPWPSEIAEANRHLPARDRGNDYDHGLDGGHSM
jgi:hypothetical protein